MEAHFLKSFIMSIKHILGYELSWKTAAVSSRILVWNWWLSVPSNHSLNVWCNKQSFKLTWVKSPHVFLQFRGCDKFGIAFRLRTFVRSLAWNAQKYRKMSVKSIWPVWQETRAAFHLHVSHQCVFVCGQWERKTQRRTCHTGRTGTVSPQCVVACGTSACWTERTPGRRCHRRTVSPRCAVCGKRVKIQLYL